MQIVENFVGDVRVGVSLLIVENWSLCLFHDHVGFEIGQLTSVEPQRILDKNVLVVVWNLSAFNNDIEVEGLTDKIFGLTVFLLIDLFRKIAFSAFVCWN